MLQYWLRIKQINCNSNKIIDSRIDDWGLLDPCLIAYTKISVRYQPVFLAIFLAISQATSVKSNKESTCESACDYDVGYVSKVVCIKIKKMICSSPVMLH